jgi:beta-galactosidase
LAEFEIINAKGESVPHDTWDFVSVSSEESLAEDGAAENAIDGQISNFYHSRWSKDTAKPPHYLVIDMGAEVEVAGFRYTPRQDSVSGRIRAWRFYLDP